MAANPIKKNATRFSAYLVAFFFLELAWWIDHKFGSPTFEQILFLVQFGTEGLIDADAGLIRSFAIDCLLEPLGFTILVFMIQAAVLSQRTKSFIQKFYKKRTNERVSGIIAKLLTRLRKAFLNLLPISLVIIGAVLLTVKLAIWSYVKTSEETKFFENYYIQPTSVTSLHKKKKNLVLIYVESLENGFSNKKIMGEDALYPLKNITAKGYTFENYLQTYGTGWTIAGIVSTQCGIPLKALTFNGNDHGETFKKFLPGATCLGDILLKQGYMNVFLQGGSLYFSGTGKFLSQHGYSKILGREDWSRLGEQDMSGWGLHDDQLLKHAKHELEVLHKTGQPFNLTLSTIDTHFPKGFISKSCEQRGAVNYTGIVSCTAALVADLITYMEKKGYLENTVVVVIGDHLAMRVPVYDQLEKFGNRTIYNRIFTKETLTKNTETLYPFSMLPTMLYTLGFRFKDNRLALGASGFGTRDPNYDITTLNPATFEELLSKSSKKYNLFLK